MTEEAKKNLERMYIAERVIYNKLLRERGLLVDASKAALAAVRQHEQKCPMCIGTLQHLDNVLKEVGE